MNENFVLIQRKVTTLLKLCFLIHCSGFSVEIGAVVLLLLRDCFLRGTNLWQGKWTFLFWSVTSVYRSLFSIVYCHRCAEDLLLVSE